MSANPYVAPVKGGMGDTWAEGSRELTDVKDLCTDVFTDHDALAAVFDAGGFALDVLGDIGDPLGAVISCAVGWIVDHVSFLRDPVDWLAGDPHSIEASMQTWANVSDGMRGAGAKYADTLNGLGPDVWAGDAADAYRNKAAEWVDALDGAASMAELESVLIAATGGLCAAFRGVIFDAISSAIERWVMVGLVALANSAWTFGASIAGWVIDVEIEAGLLAARISAKIAQLIEKAGRIAETLGKDGGKLERIGQKLVALSEKMMHDVRSTRSRLGWDRRFSNTPRTHVRDMHQDVNHLMDSLGKGTKIVHPALTGAALHTGKNLGGIALDPSVDNVDKAGGDATHDAGSGGAGKAKDAIHDARHRP